jgi:hypothetical protein
MLLANTKQFPDDLLVTEDKFDELKICEYGNKTRKVLESYIDGGIYLMKKYGKSSTILDTDTDKLFSVFQKSQRSGYARQGTQLLDSSRKTDRYCEKIRPFDDLIFDLMTWKFEHHRRSF